MRSVRASAGQSASKGEDGLGAKRACEHVRMRAREWLVNPWRAPLQAVWPTSSWYSPSSQNVHAADRGSDATLPAAHGVCTMLPVGLKCPGCASVHWLASPRLVEAVQVPASHGNGAFAPGGQ